MESKMGRKRGQLSAGKKPENYSAEPKAARKVVKRKALKPIPDDVDSIVNDIEKPLSKQDKLWKSIEDICKDCPDPIFDFFKNLAYGRHWTFLSEFKKEDLKNVLDSCKGETQHWEKSNDNDTDGQSKKEKNKKQDDRADDVDSIVNDIEKPPSKQEKLWKSIEDICKDCPDPIFDFFKNLAYGKHWTFLSEFKKEDLKNVLDSCKMTLSESQIPPDAQHYLVCGTEDCEKNCQFYCNECHQPMCEQCRYEHQKNKKTKHHEVVLYMLRKRQLPVEKCKIHPTKEIDLLCRECQIPICSKCTGSKEHRGHWFTNLEIVFDEKVSIYNEEIANIRSYFDPTSQNLKKEIAGDVTEIKKIMAGIRTSIKAEAESVKKLVDAVTLDKMEQVDKIEQSLLQTLNGQNQEIDDYINSLNGLIKTYYGYLSPSNIEQLTFALKSENLIIRPIPETSKPVPPAFTAGQYSKEDVAKLLGRITVPNTKPENRKIKPLETASTQLKPTGKQRKQDREKSDVKQALSLSSSVTKVREYTVPGVKYVFHISLGKSGRLWVSDMFSNLVQTDLQRNQLQKIQTRGVMEGYHTVTQDGDLIYTDKDNKVINRITPNNTITEFIKTGEWVPLSIHSSHINGDLLVGMKRDKEGEVTRYNKTGTEIQNIQRDNKGQGLYSGPHHITENINGDVCVSDYHNAVVVVDKSGQHKFSYTGQGSMFYPCGICINILGHILVCDEISDTVHLLDQDGQFLSLLLTSQQGVYSPRSVCVDDENNLWVGQRSTNTVTVYKYLQ